MILTIDIGNTSVKYGIFDTEGVLLHGGIATKEKGIPQEILKKYSVKEAIYCATGKINGVIKAQIKGFEHAVELSHETPIPIRSEYATPETLGRDRIAAICGGYATYPNQSLLIIDAGTCITYEILIADVYLGGNIAPGLQMRIQAMHEFTAKLPLVSLSLPEPIIGDSTQTALQNGAIRGGIMEITDFRRRIQRRFGKITTILTGGDAVFLANSLNFKTFVDRNLVLVGLYSIYAHNFLRKLPPNGGNNNSC